MNYHRKSIFWCAATSECNTITIENQYSRVLQLGKSSNALRNSIVFDDLDREINDSRKEFNSVRGKSLNALRNSIVFHDLDREIDDSLRAFNSFRGKSLNALRN